MRDSTRAPPGRSTRRSSRRAATRSSTYSIASAHSARSTLASGSQPIGSPRSWTRNSASGTRARLNSTIRGLWSKPGPSPPRSRPPGQSRHAGCGSLDGMDVTQLILDDHHEQRRLFSILEQIDRGDAGTLAAVWERLAIFLEVHAQAEEEIFYPELLLVGRRAGQLGTGGEEKVEAIGDHNEIRDTIAAVADHAVGSDGWYDAVAAVNKA